MTFSSNIFIFGFFPISILLYVITPKKYKNILLLILSILFYLWACGSLVYLLIISIFINYYIGRIIGIREYKYSKIAISAGITIDLLFLFYYKYLKFFISEITKIVPIEINIFGQLNEIILPIGISFYSFRAISYLIEVYKKDIKAETNIINYGMYLSLFPIILAGPIVRYSEIKDEIKNRNISIENFFEGLWRFSIGLGKKAVLATNFGITTDKIFNLPANEFTTPLAWLGIICYTFQIYYDFSGYTDMAIGLGYMFGFKFPENFNQPYRSKSISEFWRRWHMTLSFWLRDFIYIPLGGSRKGHLLNYANLFIVFFLCGLWHGAAWTFILWGVYHGIIIIIERFLKNNFNYKAEHIISLFITFLLIMIGWIFFRATNLDQAFLYLKYLFGLNENIEGFKYFHFNYYLQNDLICFLVIGAIFAFLPVDKITKNQRLNNIISNNYIIYLKGFIILALTIYSLSVISTSSFTPFIYFRF